MNVPLYDSTGLNIYRELMHRESRCAADWSVNYGVEALQKPPDPELMMNLGKFAKFASVPMPLDVQLRELRKERRAQSAKVTRFEKETFPTSTEIPVSAMSVDIWGDKAWHTQAKKAQGAPSTYKKFEPPPTRWSRRQWDVDNIKFVREGLAPAHVNARLRKQTMRSRTQLLSNGTRIPSSTVILIVPGLLFATVREAYGASNASLDTRTRLPKPAWAD